MAIGIKVCKVCGKEYEACHTLRPNLNNEFRWQDVACSPEHGEEYLRQILISRGKLPAEPVQDEPAAAEPEEAPAQAKAQKKRRNKKQASAEDAAPVEGN